MVTLLDVSLPTPVFAQVQNLNLLWDPPDAPEVDHYNVYIGTASGAHDVAVTQVPGSQASYWFPATAGVLYYFAVSAVNAAGIESPLSQEISGSVPLLFSLPDRASTVDIAIPVVQLSAVDPDGGVLRFSHTGLPLGLILDPVSGTIVGIPTSTGTFDVTVFVSDGVLSSSQTFQWAIRTPGSADTTAPALSITSHTSGQSITSSTITLSGTATDSGLGDSGITRVTVNGLPASGGTSSFTGTANWSRSITLSGSTNTVLVEALDGSGNFSAQLITLTRDLSPPLLTISSHTSAQTVPTNTITLSGTASDSATGGNGVSSVRVNGSSASGGTASGSGTASWSRSVTLSVGPNVVTVVATDNAGNSRTAAITINYTPLPLAITSLTSNLASPQAAGTAIGFTANASGGTAPYQYKWWVQSNGVWTVAQGWSSSATLNWQPTTSGTYMVAVWGRNAGVTADASQALAQVPYTIGAAASGAPAGVTSPLSISSLTSDLDSPQPTGTAVRFTANASGGTAPYEFKWWVQSGGVWSVAREWSSSATLTWQPTTAGNYMVAVWGRNAGVTADASQAMSQTAFVVAAGGSSGGSSNSTSPLSIISFISNVGSPQTLGNPVTFTATGAGGTAPYQFKWWVQSGGVWTVAREWSANPQLTWQATSAGSYNIAVWARSAGVTADASQALAQAAFVISPPLNGGGGSSGGGASTGPLSISGIWSNIASPQVPGAAITFTTGASGGSGPYQFKWWIQSGGVWSVAQDWSTSTSFFWRPSSAGTYMVAVWGRNAGVGTDAAQALAQTTYLITSNGLMPLGVTLSNSVSSPRTVGSTVTFTASASGGSGSYQFKWWVWDGSVWAVAQNWSSSRNLTWRPTGAGTYMVAVWVRNSGVTADASEALAQVPYLITP